LDSVLDRFETTGVINPELISPLNISGPAARASEWVLIPSESSLWYISSWDWIFGLLKKAMFFVDLISSLKKYLILFPLYKHLLLDLNQFTDQDIRSELVIKDGCALTLVEAPRGQNLHWLYIKNG
jgi:hypothetical protein